MIISTLWLQTVSSYRNSWKRRTLTNHIVKLHQSRIVDVWGYRKTWVHVLVVVCRREGSHIAYQYIMQYNLVTLCLYDCGFYLSHNNCVAMWCVHLTYRNRTARSVQLVVRQMTGSQINTSMLRTSWPNLRDEDTCGILLYFRWYFMIRGWLKSLQPVKTLFRQ